MKLKSNKGYVGVDIAMALVILAILLPMVAAGIYNINKSNSALRRKSEALNMALNTIETFKGCELKSDDEMIEDIINNINFSSITENDDKTTVVATVIRDEETYKMTISIKDYSKDNSTVQENMIKTATVMVEYRVGGKTENIEISTVLT